MTSDELAQEIRRVDGENSLGAGALAEVLMPFLSRTPAPEGEGKRLMLVDLDGAPFGSEFLDNLNGYATGGSGRCLDILTMWGATLYASPVVPVGVSEDQRQRIAEIVEAAIERHAPTKGVCHTLDDADAILAALGTKGADTGREG